MPHGRHIYAKEYDMAKATICSYSQSYHALPHCKFVLQCCARFPSINLPDQEIDDQYPDTSPSIHFRIYCLIARCTKHGRIPLIDRKLFHKCQQDSDSVQSTIIYTLKELVMIETNIYNFHTSFIFQKFRSWRFIFIMYKYWVLITVVNPVDLRLNAANNFKMFYVAMIILRGQLLVLTLNINIFISTIIL